MVHAFSKAVLTAVMFSTVALAQQTTATLTGTITDPVGAVVADVTITATNLATNAVRETRTGDTGSYTLPFLPAGEYSVTAVAPGLVTKGVNGSTRSLPRVRLRKTLTFHLPSLARYGPLPT